MSTMIKFVNLCRRLALITSKINQYVSVNSVNKISRDDDSSITAI